MNNSEYILLDFFWKFDFFQASFVMRQLEILSNTYNQPVRVKLQSEVRFVSDFRTVWTHKEICYVSLIHVVKKFWVLISIIPKINFCMYKNSTLKCFFVKFRFTNFSMNWDWSKNMLLLKNPQFLRYHFETWTKWVSKW